MAKRNMVPRMTRFFNAFVEFFDGFSIVLKICAVVWSVLFLLPSIVVSLVRKELVFAAVGRYAGCTFSVVLNNIAIFFGLLALSYLVIVAIVFIIVKLID